MPADSQSIPRSSAKKSWFIAAEVIFGEEVERLPRLGLVVIVAPQIVLTSIPGIKFGGQAAIARPET